MSDRPCKLCGRPIFLCVTDDRKIALDLKAAVYLVDHANPIADVALRQEEFYVDHADVCPEVKAKAAKKK